MKTKWVLAFVFALVANGLTAGESNAQTQHPNGLGQNYVDAQPLGTPGMASTYNANMATEAANAWPSSGTTGSVTCGFGASASHAVMKQTPTSCAVWAYSGSHAGYVHLNQGNACMCPSNTDPVWK